MSDASDSEQSRQRRQTKALTSKPPLPPPGAKERESVQVQEGRKRNFARIVESSASVAEPVSKRQRVEDKSAQPPATKPQPKVLHNVSLKQSEPKSPKQITPAHNDHEKEPGSSDIEVEDEVWDEDDENATGSDMDEDLPPTPSKSALVLDHHKYPPADLPSWRDAGTLSGIGDLVPLCCYDDDPTKIGDRESKHAAGPSDILEETTAITATGGNDEADEEDAAAIQMQAAVRSHQKKMMHMDPTLLEEMCTFYKINLDDAKRYDSVFTIKGMRRSLKVYQLYGAYFILRQEALGCNDTKVVSGNTILADSPGFGKSACAATITASSKMVEDAWTEVMMCRRSKDISLLSKHLPKSTETHPQATNAKCPSQESMPICCPCVASGPTAKLRRVMGIVIFVVPPALLINSIEEWYQQVDMDKNELGFRVHAQTTIEKGTKAQMVRLQVGDEKRTVDVFSLYMNATKATALRNEGTNKRLRGLSGNVFFTTAPSYHKNMVTTGIHHIPCGRYFRDEFHQEPSIKNRMMRFARELIIQRADAEPFATPKIVQMSGTPIRLGARDWVGIASLWSLCVLLIENNWDLPEGVEIDQMDNIKKWPTITTYIEDQFWRDYTPSGLAEMTAQWSRKPEMMRSR